MKKETVFQVGLMVITVLVIAGLLRLTLPYLEVRYQPLIVRYIASNMTSDEKQKLLSRLEVDAFSLYSEVADPLVGMIGKRNIVILKPTEALGTNVSNDMYMNNAGMRSKKPYLPKKENSYRIVCLGDSFVFGQGVDEEDRFCNQIGTWFQKNAIQIKGKQIETVTIGHSGWTMLQQATYMLTRLTDYDPDLIIVLTVDNDIQPNLGVTSNGMVTTSYSSEERSYGSGIFQNVAALPFNYASLTGLALDVTPSAQYYWKRGVQSLKRLSEVQKQRGGDILFSVLNSNGGEPTYFEDVYRQQFLQAHIDAPYMQVTYLRSNDTMVIDDGHPNRLGHQIMADQYLLALAKLGLIPPSSTANVSQKVIPEFNPPVSEYLQSWRDDIFNRLFAEIDFSAITGKNDGALGFLGGIVPDSNTAKTGKGLPWCLNRCGFVLKNKYSQPGYVKVVIDIPKKSELFPLKITARIQGSYSVNYDFDEPGIKEIKIPLQDKILPAAFVEVILENGSYFSTLEDSVMKSYQMVSAGIYAGK